MSDAISIALVGEFTPSFLPHGATNDAIEHAQSAYERRIAAEWISTVQLESGEVEQLQRFDAIWIVPGSPYKSLLGAINAIRYARESGVPLLGTCGGCQHVVIEYSRNVMGFEDAAHAEYDPYASNLFITPLSCSLVGQTMEVKIEPGSLADAIYGGKHPREQYYCNFGLNPEHQQKLHDAGLRIVGTDPDGEARILTIPEHRFFLATLYVPQLTSSITQPHPVILAFMKAAMESNR
jgi:CTP synthase (UTP-ammonia lyase)